VNFAALRVLADRPCQDATVRMTFRQFAAAAQQSARSLLSARRSRRFVLGAAAVATLAGCGAASAGDGSPAPRPSAMNVVRQASASTAVSAQTAKPQASAAVSAATGSATPAPTATPPAPSMLTVLPQAPGCPIFPADNVWNSNISKLPVDVHSAAWLKSMDSGSTYLHPDFGPNDGGFPYGMPITFVTSKQAKVKLKFQYASESYRGKYPFGPGTLIEGGKHASMNTDRHAIMLDTSTCTLYELWQAKYSASGSTAGSGAMWHLNSNALRPASWTSADAAGLPILPGLLDYAQIKAAVKTGQPITHAIRMTADATAAAYLWPARHEAGSGSVRTLPPMGARFRLKASFSIKKFCSNSQPYCRDAKAVLTEMKHYGLIVADNGSNWFFQGSAYPQWPDDLVSLLKQIPARAFQAVNESCLMVSENSGQARSGCPAG
jgi:hypothetical protein